MSWTWTWMWWLFVVMCVGLQVLGLVTLKMWVDVGWRLVVVYRWKSYYAWNHPVREKVTSKERKKWSAAIQRRIEYNQRYRCPLCWRLLPPERDLDHIRPLYQLGADAEWNLQILDGNCHHQKTRSIDRQRITTVGHKDDTKIE